MMFKVSIHDKIKATEAKLHEAMSACDGGNDEKVRLRAKNDAADLSAKLATLQIERKKEEDAVRNRTSNAFMPAQSTQSACSKCKESENRIAVLVAENEILKQKIADLEKKA